MRSEKFRIAVREFGPFESALVKQWDAFERNAHTGLEFEPIAMDLHTLFESTFVERWFALAATGMRLLSIRTGSPPRKSKALCSISRNLFGRNRPTTIRMAGAPSLLRMQESGGQVLGLPYHDGPECLIYRTDLFDDPSEQQRHLATLGKPLRVPQTWEEFESAARFFHRPNLPLYGAILRPIPTVTTRCTISAFRFGRAAANWSIAAAVSV